MKFLKVLFLFALLLGAAAAGVAAYVLKATPTAANAQFMIASACRLGPYLTGISGKGAPDCGCFSERFVKTIGPERAGTLMRAFQDRILRRLRGDPELSMEEVGKMNADVMQPFAMATRACARE